LSCGYFGLFFIEPFFSHAFARKVGGNKQNGDYRKYFDHRLLRLGDYTDYSLRYCCVEWLESCLKLIAHTYDLVRDVAVFELLQ